jgi:hypothetical protein
MGGPKNWIDKTWKPPSSLSEPDNFLSSSDMPFVSGFPLPVLTRCGLCGHPLTLARVSAALHPKSVPDRQDSSGGYAALATWEPDPGVVGNGGVWDVQLLPGRSNVAVMITNNPLGLPRSKNFERPQFRDDGFGPTVSAVQHHARRFSHRETIEKVFAHIEREPMLARRLDREDWLTRANIFAHLRGDDADHTVGRSTQDHHVARTCSVHASAI